jgi:hypothetical protein
VSGVMQVQSAGAITRLSNVDYLPTSGPCVPNVSSNRKVNDNNEVRTRLTTVIAVRSRCFSGQSVVGCMLPNLRRRRVGRNFPSNNESMLSEGE